MSCDVTVFMLIVCVLGLCVCVCFRCRPTCMSWVRGSLRMMVGTSMGGVHAVDVATFQATEDPFVGERLVECGTN